MPDYRYSITIILIALFPYDQRISGIGLPAAAMAMLTIAIDPKTAISLMVLPIIFANVMQYFRSEAPRKTAYTYRYFALAIMISIFTTSLFIASYPTSLLTVAIGVAMVVFSINLLFGVTLPISGHLGWQVGIGYSLHFGQAQFDLVAASGDVSAGPQCVKRRIYRGIRVLVSCWLLSWPPA